MKVLVTGGAGFVGSNLIKRLLEDGNEVICLDNYSTGKKENELEGCKYFNFDLSESNVPFDEICAVQRFEKPDIIYHMAALARIQPSIKNPVKSIGNNFNSTLNILEWAREKNIPMVFAGSSSFHHGLWGSPYAWSKHAGEQLCKLYDNVYNLPVATCRFYNVYGPNQLEDGAYATVLGIFIKQHKEGRPLTITGNGEQRRDFTHVDDIVDALIRIQKQQAYNNNFELGRGKNYSVNEIAKMLKINPIYKPGKPGEARNTLNTDRLAIEMLGWEPQINLEDYLASYL